MSHSEMERRHEEAEAHIRAAMTNALCAVMDGTNLPPMVLLRLAARSLGLLYGDMADAHSGANPCPCGWRSHRDIDIEVMITALLAACEPRPAVDIRRMPVAGTA